MADIANLMRVPIEMSRDQFKWVEWPGTGPATVGGLMAQSVELELISFRGSFRRALGKTVRKVRWGRERRNG